MDRDPIWKSIMEQSSKIDVKEWKKLPKDGAENLDHYLYGSKKNKQKKGKTMTIGDFINLMNEEQRESLVSLSEIEDVLLAGNVEQAFALIQKYKKEHIYPRDLDRDVLKNCMRKEKKR